MLKYFSIFKCNCNPHLACSFHLHVRILIRTVCFFTMLTTFSLTKMICRTIADPVIPTPDQKQLSMDNAVCNLLSGGFVYLCHRSSGNIHLPGALLVSQLLQVDQADHLILVYCQDHLLPAGYSLWDKAVISRFRADSSAPAWSCHRSRLRFQRKTLPYVLHLTWP